jgi:hypothetical protein
VTGFDFPPDEIGDVANALDPGHRGAAEFHHDAGHEMR